MQAMFAALLYSTAGLALTAVGLLGVMAATAFASILFAVIGGESSQPVWLLGQCHNAVCNQAFLSFAPLPAFACRHHVCKLYWSGGYNTGVCKLWAGSCHKQRCHCSSCRYASCFQLFCNKRASAWQEYAPTWVLSSKLTPCDCLHHLRMTDLSQLTACVLMVGSPVFLIARDL